MAIQTINNSGSSNRRLATRALTTDRALPSVDWVRPNEWPALPAITASDEKVVGLLAVYEVTDGNFIGLTVTGSGGGFSIDWGDGTTNTYSSGYNSIVHQYDYSNSSLTPTSYGYKCAIVTITPLAGKHISAINLSQAPSWSYSSVSPWLDLAISLPSAGSIVISSNGSGYLHSLLERVQLLNIGSVTSLSSMFVYCYSLRSVIFGSTAAVTNMDSIFKGCYSLRSGPVIDTSACTSMQSAFDSCYALQEIPPYKTSNLVNAQSMFNCCYSLTEVPLLDLSKVTTMGQMFYGCYSLRHIPAFKTSLVTNMSSAFNGTAIKETPALDYSAVQTMTGIFQGCSKLEKAGIINSSNATSMSSIFSGCGKLRSVESIDTSKATSLASVFSNCASLRVAPVVNSGLATNITGMFQGCSSLTTIPALNTQNATYVSYLFSGCYSLKSIPALDLSKATDISFIFAYCLSLKKLPSITFSNAITSAMFAFCNNGITSIPSMNLASATSLTNFANQGYGLNSSGATGARYSIDYSYCPLSIAAMHNIFDNLGIAANTSQVININSTRAQSQAGNYGVFADTTAGSKTLACTYTGGISVGDFCVGTGISTGVSVTLQDSGNTVTRAGHGLANGTRVHFSDLSGVSDIANYTPYYVVNASTDTFQLAATQGGSAIELTADGTGTIYYPAYVASIVTDTSITLTAPASATNTQIIASFSKLDRSRAYCKGWQVQG